MNDEFRLRHSSFIIHRFRKMSSTSATRTLCLAYLMADAGPASIASPATLRRRAPSNTCTHFRRSNDAARRVLQEVGNSLLGDERDVRLTGDGGIDPRKTV